MDSPLIQACLWLLAFAALGGLLPLLRTWSDKSLHVLLSVAAGVFLGALFLELLPELSQKLPEQGHEASGNRLPWAAALAGLLLLFFLEHIWLRERAAGKGGHLVVWLGTFAGLTTHAFVVGLSLSAMITRPEVLSPLLVAISVHKTAESFSLATVMRLAELPLKRAWTCMGVFCLATPAGLLVGSRMQGAVESTGSWTSLFEGLAAGTFLYVAAYNLLPEVFHGHEQRGRRVLGLLAGLGIFALTTYLTHEAH